MAAPPYRAKYSAAKACRSSDLVCDCGHSQHNSFKAGWSTVRFLAQRGDLAVARADSCPSLDLPGCVQVVGLTGRIRSIPGVSRVDVHRQRQRLVRTLEADDDIAGLLPCLDVPVGLDDLVQRICSVDDRLERPGLD
jgi:hypothetical protein